MSLTPLKAYLAGVASVAALLLVGSATFVLSGWYPMGADEHHHPLTYKLITVLRERSIERAASDIVVPKDLDSPDRLLAGGADYNDMCASCHLKPGKNESDFSLGLYPSPPNLTQISMEPNAMEKADQRRFWIIKHGIKASGMPAWGPTHDDERIWNMVAFLQRLPELSQQQYQILTARGE